MGLESAITRIQTLALATTGVKAAPDKPPEAITAFPFVVTYPSEGEFDDGAAGARRGLHTVIMEFHVTRQHLPKNYEAALPIFEALLTKIWGDPKLNGEVGTIISINYNLVPLAWAGQKEVHLGWRASILFKHEEAYT